MTAKHCLDGLAPFKDREREAAEETYGEVEDYIRWQVWDLVRRYGGDFEDMMAEAASVFVAAYQTYQPGGGHPPFTIWLRNFVRWTLIDELRIRLKHQARHDPVDPAAVPRTYGTFSPAGFAEELGDDARLVVKLVVDTPAELLDIVQGKGNQPRNFRSSIRQYLAEAGWTAIRVAAAFREIQRAVKE